MDLTGLTGEAAVPTVPQSVFLVNKNHEKRQHIRGLIFQSHSIINT